MTYALIGVVTMALAARANMNTVFGSGARPDSRRLNEIGTRH